MRGAFLILFLLASSPACAQPDWVEIGSTASAKFFVDKNAIENRTYMKPGDGSDGRIIGQLAPAKYRETWVQGVDEKGQVAYQMLWVFDCAGRAAELAASTPDPKTSYDVSNRAEMGGIESLMRRIPPNSLYRNSEAIVCKK